MATDTLEQALAAVEDPMIRAFCRYFGVHGNKLHKFTVDLKKQKGIESVTGYLASSLHRTAESVMFQLEGEGPHLIRLAANPFDNYKSYVVRIRDEENNTVYLRTPYENDALDRENE